MNQLSPNTEAQKSASLLSHSLKSGICVRCSGAPLFQFSHLLQDFTSAGHLFPEFPRDNTVKADAALSRIQTLPLLEPKLITRFMILHRWQGCVLSASSPNSDGPQRKKSCSFRFCLLLNFLAQSEVVLLILLKGNGSIRPMLGWTCWFCLWLCPIPGVLKEEYKFRWALTDVLWLLSEL